MAEQFAGTPVEAKVAATCTLKTAFQEVWVESDAVQEVAELSVGRVQNFVLAIEVCICMDLDGFVRVDVLQELFGLNFYLREKNCYINHLRRKQKSTHFPCLEDGC